MGALLEVIGLKKYFRLDSHSSIYAVDDVSLTLQRGETLGLVGESGSGKTTVGRCILRLLEPTAGRIIFDGSEITNTPLNQLGWLRRRMSIVFQDPYGSLNPAMSVGQMVAEPLRFVADAPAGRSARVAATLDLVQLGTAYLGRYPHQLTASEQQRVAIARAIVTRPDLVVVDEATSSLDPSVRAVVLQVLMDLQAELGLSYLFISHDLTAVEQISHRVAIMYLGRLVEVASTDALFRRQLHPYSRALLSAVLYPDPGRSLEPFMLTGEIPSPINPPDECALVGRCPFAQDRCSAARPSLVPLEGNHLVACYRADEFLVGGVPSLSAEGQLDAFASPAIGAHEIGTR